MMRQPVFVSGKVSGCKLNVTIYEANIPMALPSMKYRTNFNEMTGKQLMGYPTEGISVLNIVKTGNSGKIYWL